MGGLRKSTKRWGHTLRPCGRGHTHSHTPSTLRTRTKIQHHPHPPHLHTPLHRPRTSKTGFHLLPPFGSREGKSSWKRRGRRNSLSDGHVHEQIRRYITGSVGINRSKGCLLLVSGWGLFLIDQWDAVIFTSLSLRCLWRVWGGRW